MYIVEWGACTANCHIIRSCLQDKIVSYLTAKLDAAASQRNQQISEVICMFCNLGEEFGV